MDNSMHLYLKRIVEALERISPPPPHINNIEAADAFTWSNQTNTLDPIHTIDFVEFSLLQGINRQKEILFENTWHFAKGLPSNNVVLWGARGMGKSSLVKSVHQEVNKKLTKSIAPLKIIEIFKDDIHCLPNLLCLLKKLVYRFIIFSDDLSFEKGEHNYKALKSILDGGITGRPSNVLFYATSNRRHLMPREMIENEANISINSIDTIEEKISLSDRFGLWIGFHQCTKELFNTIVKSYAHQRHLPIDDQNLIIKANEWSITRGARSGRVAWQFIEDLTAKLHS
ncbi:hypothetical protein COMNV_01208 [Commensalibacter sp. Nvir]|uniref:ATP-binding protein n=1 Tax=Commensalibacter sp. Nvir TaxID=3069817 RepID=UPI002D3AFC11|nr:hypothetical protein COMNV_01208 [Commensalibacter sp. Nvir]